MIQTILSILIGVLVIAASSIGIQFYNKCESLHGEDKMKRNRNFLIAMLVLAILLIVASVGIKGMQMKKARAMKAYTAMAQ
tara:strand:+ start:943 stop:1185 length:243 start_codon:yes stop_codon:yes gene_type:complete